jgi:stage II sporulation protein D
VQSVRVRTGGRVHQIPLEEYVLGTVLSEVTPLGTPPEASLRIFEVQAVLARTYALSSLGRHEEDGFDVCDATHCQLYEPARIATSRFAAVARRAVDETRAVVLTFGDQPAEALYHSDCGGHTASADEVWGRTHVPYLTGMQDDVTSVSHRSWQFEAGAERIRAALNQTARTAVGRRLTELKVAARDSSGRAATVQIRGEVTRTVRGEDLRAALNRRFGDRAIMSTRFSLLRSGSSYRFTGTGFGHGVGLCQTGAAARAVRGEPLTSILSSYFPGTALVRVRTARGATANLLGLTVPRLVESP